MTKLNKKEKILVLNRLVEIMQNDLNAHLVKALRKAVEIEISKKWDNKEFNWFLLAESAACEKFAQEVKKQNEGF